MLTHLRQCVWMATVSARHYELSASTIHNRLRKKKTISSVRTALKRSDNDETSQACVCNGLDANSSGSVSTRTGFRSVAKPDLHSAMLVVKLTNKRCWDCYVLDRDRFGVGQELMCYLVWAVSWFGVEKWVTRRRTLLSCKTISRHSIDDVL